MNVREVLDVLQATAEARGLKTLNLTYSPDARYTTITLQGYPPITISDMEAANTGTDASTLAALINRKLEPVEIRDREICWECGGDINVMLVGAYDLCDNCRRAMKESCE